MEIKGVDESTILIKNAVEVVLLSLEERLRIILDVVFNAVSFPYIRKPASTLPSIITAAKAIVQGSVSDDDAGIC